MTMALKVANNAVSTLAGAIAAGDTTLAIAAGDAGKFPTLAAGNWFPLTIVDASGNMEIVKVTDRTGAALTVTRGQEGTTPRSFAAGAKCDIRFTAGTLEAALAEKAALDSPALQNNPTAPTKPAGDHSDSLATTSFVGDAITTAMTVVKSNGKRDLTISTVAPTSSDGVDGDVWFLK